MKDPFMTLFSWLTPIISDPAICDLPLSTTESTILNEFRLGWAQVDTATLLRSLTDKYGDVAGETIEKVLSKRIQRDWAETGKREARSGNEINDFIRILWEPLKNEGFEFTQTVDGQNVKFCVKKCPVKELGDKTGLHKWLYHLACATDLYSTPAFSSNIEFIRTKTLMEGKDCCDHTYIAK